MAGITDILDPKEEVEEEGILATLFGMSYEHIETLQEQTHPSRLATFKSKASQLNMVRSQLTQLSVTVHQLRQMDQTPGVRDKINSIAKIVIRLNSEEAELESMLVALASQRDHTFHSILLPSAYGNTHSLSKDDYYDILKFNPSGKTKFLHCWMSCLKRGESISKPGPNRRSPLSEEGWKNFLSGHLLGEALDYFFVYRDLPLKDLIQVLSNRFEKPVDLRSLQKQYENLKKQPDEPFRKIESMTFFQSCSFFSYASQESFKISDLERFIFDKFQ